jgi:carbamoyl-phosphate synthase small subunit
MHKHGRLMLASGLEFYGNCLYENDDVVIGEVVFSTATTGYTEILTDPSYYGQIVVLAHPEVGNYGVNLKDLQSSGIKVRGLVVRNLSIATSSFRAEMTLADFLLREKIPALFGIDTRALILHVRDFGATMAAFTANGKLTSEELYALAKAAPPLEAEKISDAVSVRAAIKAEPLSREIYGRIKRGVPKIHVVAIDFGIKDSLLRYLEHFGAQVTLVPNDSTAEEIWAHRPDGLFLSNGPGDPKKEVVAVATVRALLGKLPIFGVCMGHQVLAQSLGYDTFKLKFGHRGSNQAVKRVEGSLITTAQNHGFAIINCNGRIETPLYEDINVADGTNEGLDLPHLFAFSVQFHPEGAPGPHDAVIYFEKFLAYIRASQKRDLEKDKENAVETGA